jgi:hypothetical protein
MSGPLIQVPARPRGVDAPPGPPILDQVKPIADILSKSSVTVGRVDLVGLKEIGELLGVSKQRAGQLAEQVGFPKPLGEISAGRVWKRADVEVWARREGRIK